MNFVTYQDIYVEDKLNEHFCVHDQLTRSSYVIANP